MRHYTLNEEVCVAKTAETHIQTENELQFEQETSTPAIGKEN
jgi:hypothetical protein